jgi:hypothetical protein
MHVVILQRYKEGAYAQGSDHEDDDHIPEYGTLEDVDVLVREVRQAIDDGIHPEIIVQGSSGSYFVRNRNREVRDAM